MRILCLVLSIVIFLASVRSSLAQNPSPTGATSSVVATAVQQAGWGIDWTTTSFTYSGTVSTLNPGDDAPTAFSVNGEFKGRWVGRLNVVGSSTSSSVVNGQAAWTQTSSGVQTLPFDGLYDTLAIFPFLTDLTLSDSSVTVSVDGMTDVNGTKAYQITVHRAAASTLASARRLNLQATDTHIWLAADTLLPLRTETFRPAIDNLSATISVRRDYSNYKQVNGIAVPFTIQEFLEGTLTSTTTITNIQFAVPLPDSDFAFQN